MNSFLAEFVLIQSDRKDHIFLCMTWFLEEGGKWMIDFKKALSQLLAIFIVAAVLCPVMPAAAEANIDIEVKAGFQGKVKSGKGFPVVMTFENHGANVSGDMLIDSHLLIYEIKGVLFSSHFIKW